MNSLSGILLLFIIIICLYLFPLSIKYSRSNYGQVSGNSFLRTIFDKGNYGEFLTFQLLEKLDGDNKLLTNVYIPKPDNTTTEIDLLMLNNTGIYVFESKNYSGWIFGDENKKYWTQTLKNGQKHKFLNPIWQNKGHISALNRLLGEAFINKLYSYVVFSERCELKKVKVLSTDIAVIKRNKLFERVNKDMAARSKVLSDEQVVCLHEELVKYALADAATKAQHIENIQIKKEL